MEMINDASIKPISKVRAFLHTEKQQNDNLLFQNLSFEDIAILKKEVNDEDFKIMDYMV